MTATALISDGAGLWDEVCQVVAASAKLPPPYPEGASLYDELGLESVHALTLLLALEERFAVTLDDQKFIKCTTVASLVDLVREARR